LFEKIKKRLQRFPTSVNLLQLKLALSHGVVEVAVAALGSADITAWLTQASDNSQFGPTQDGHRDRTKA
jgi:hypothetical protein